MPYWPIVQGALTLLIGFIATYIAWQQSQSTQLKINMDRYERRLKVFLETQKFIAQVNRDLKPEIPDLFGFYAATSEADFIFPLEIRKYLDEIYSHANKLRSAKEQYRDYTQICHAGYDHQNICAILEEQANWFMDQHKIALEKFRQYMDISK